MVHNMDPRAPKSVEAFSTTSEAGSRPEISAPKGAAVTFNVIAVAARFFEATARFFSELKDKIISLFPKRIAIWLDPRRKILYALLRVPTRDRADVLQHSLLLISPQIKNIEDFKEAVGAEDRNVASKLLPLVIPKVFSRTLSLSSPASCEIDIIQAMAGAEPDLRELITANVDVFFAHEPTVDSIRKIITAMQKLQSEERKEALSQARQLISQVMTIEEKMTIVEAVYGLPASEKEEIVTKTSLLITPEMKAKSILEILETVRGLQPEEREDVISKAREAITSKMDAPSRLKIVAAVRDLGPRRATVCDEAFKLITLGMNADDRVRLIKGLRDPATPARKKIVSLTARLVTRQTSAQARENIIRMLGPIEGDANKESLVSGILECFTEEMTDDERVDIITTVEHLPRLEREAIVKNALKLISDQTDTQARVKIIKLMDGICSWDRGSFVLVASNFLTPKMDSETRVRIIEAVSDLLRNQGVEGTAVASLNLLRTPEERAEVIDYALQLDSRCKAKWVNTLTSMAQSDRDAFVQKNQRGIRESV